MMNFNEWVCGVEGMFVCFAVGGGYFHSVVLPAIGKRRGGKPDGKMDFSNNRVPAFPC